VAGVSRVDLGVLAEMNFISAMQITELVAEQ